MENRGLTLLAGLGLGAGLMYLLDPQTGRRRRALARDRAYALWHETREGWDTLQKDVRNRASGLAAEVRSRWSAEEVDDRVLCDRVRSHLGRAVSHPRAIEVTARNGRVTLSGPVLAAEVGQLLRCVRAVPGVKEVEDRLEAHPHPGSHPALQGGRVRPGRRWELFQNNWSPTMRLLVGLTGGGLLAYGFSQRSPWACLTGSLGLGLLAAGVTNRGMRDLLPKHLGEWVPEAVRAPFESGREEGESQPRPAAATASSAGEAPVF